MDKKEIDQRSYFDVKRLLDSPEDVRLDGRLEDEDDYQERKKHKDAQREKSHLKHLPTVGTET